MSPRFLMHPALFAALATIGGLPAIAAGPPLPGTIVPDIAQQRVQTEALIQQARAQARIASDQAKAQARLEANQARLEGQVAAQEARAQAQVDTQQRIAASAPIAEPPLPMSGPMAGSSEEPLAEPFAVPSAGPLRRPAGTMELITLTPRLGSYFGTDHGVLVARAPMHGVLKLQDGDVILSIGGRTPASSSQAIRILTSYDPGEKIRLVMMREHHRMDVTATMPAPPSAP